MNSIAYPFLKLRCNESICFGLVQAKTPRQAFLGKEAKLWMMVISCEGGVEMDR
jgi:hypothetical protein